MLRLEVGPEGVVKAVTVKQSSGYSVLDERAITKLRSVALPEIPDQLRQRTFAVDIPFRFALKTATTGVECGDVEIDTSGSSSLVNLEAANDALRRYRTMVAYVMARAIPRGDYPPEGQREGSEGSTTVRLHIDASGLLKEVTVAKSSGFSVLDDYAVSKSRTVMLPDIPEVLRGRAFNLNVPFHFHYHKPEKQEAGVVLPGPSLK
jgi:TonB family protein